MEKKRITIIVLFFMTLHVLYRIGSRMWAVLTRKSQMTYQQL